MEDVLIPIVIIPTVFGSFIWAIYLVVSAIRSRQQMRLSSEFHSKLLERIGSARELGELLNTEGGRSLLQTLVIHHAPAPHQRILRAAQSGTVLVTIGVGTWIALMLAVRDWPRGWAPRCSSSRRCSSRPAPACCCQRRSRTPFRRTSGCWTGRQPAPITPIP